MADIELLELEVESLLCKQTLEKLTELAKNIGVKDDISKFSKLRVIKEIRKIVEETISNPETVEVELDKYLSDILTFLTTKPPDSTEPPSLEETADKAEVVFLEKQFTELKIKQKHDLEEIEKKLQGAKQKILGNTRSDSSTNAESPEQKKMSHPKADPPVQAMWRREFKIAGQIGEPGQKDKLTYVSLIHQIDSGVDNGFSEKDISDAIIKSISPHSSLRNYILTLPDRSLSKLRPILRVFFQEKTAADLFQELVTHCQAPTETAQQFLLRTLDARNKVLFATQEENVQAEYTNQLVQKSFLKSFETGLRDETLVTNLRPSLRQSTVSDEELMKQVNELATKQAERKLKIGTTSERPKPAKVTVHSVANDDKPPPSKNVSHPNQQAHGTEKLSADLHEIKSNLADLQRQLNEKQSASQYPPQFQSSRPPRFQNFSRGRGRNRGRSWGPRPGRYQRPRGCPNCQQNGWGDSCQHCFKCGVPGHFQIDCPNVQGNEPRLVQGGEE